MAKIHPRAPYSCHYPPHPHHHHHHASSSGTESAHWACRIWGDDPGHIPDIGLLNLGEGSGERRSSRGGGGGVEVGGRKGRKADSEKSGRGFAFHYHRASPHRLPPPAKRQRHTHTENIYTYLQATVQTSSKPNDS